MDRPDSIGARLDVFGPWRANVLAGYAIAALCATGGAVLVARVLMGLPVFFKKLDTNLKLFAGGMSVVLFGLAGLFAYLAHRHAARRFDLHEHGFGYWDTRGGAVAFWPEVAGFEVVFTYVRIYNPPRELCKLIITLRDGRQFRFDRETMSRFGRFKKLLQAIAAAHGIPWVTTGRG